MSFSSSQFNFMLIIALKKRTSAHFTTQMLLCAFHDSNRSWFAGGSKVNRPTVRLYFIFGSSQNTNDANSEKKGKAKIYHYFQATSVLPTWAKVGTKYETWAMGWCEWFHGINFFVSFDGEFHFEIFGIISRDTRKCHTWPIDDRKTATLRPYFQRSARPRQRINTDGYGGYRFLSKEGYRHAFAFHNS